MNKQMKFVINFSGIEQAAFNEIERKINAAIHEIIKEHIQEKI